jgi:hypothetical protein
MKRIVEPGIKSLEIVTNNCCLTEKKNILNSYIHILEELLAFIRRLATNATLRLLIEEAKTSLVSLWLTLLLGGGT